MADSAFGTWKQISSTFTWGRHRLHCDKELCTQEISTDQPTVHVTT